MSKALSVETSKRYPIAPLTSSQFATKPLLVTLVASPVDPGVYNWLDSGGFTEGTLIGRWQQCSSEPVPQLKRVKIGEVRDHLPDFTRCVTQEEREAMLRQRRIGAQLRRRW